LDFAKRVHLEFNPDLADSSEGRPSNVEVRLKDGKILSRHVEYAKGGPQAPLSAQEMRTKFVDCARRAIDEAAIQNVVEYVERLETLKDVGDLCALLAGEKR
jgi:2-methylcitrate dehydratase PrpD